MDTRVVAGNVGNVGSRSVFILGEGAAVSYSLHPEVNSFMMLALSMRSDINVWLEGGEKKEDAQRECILGRGGERNRLCGGKLLSNTHFTYAGTYSDINQSSK